MVFGAAYGVAESGDPGRAGGVVNRQLQTTTFGADGLRSQLTVTTAGFAAALDFVDFVGGTFGAVRVASGVVGAVTTSSRTPGVVDNEL
jgi:hypothetical protein